MSSFPPHMALAIPASIAIPVADSPSNVIIHGWLLKKRRKKLQGFARRYFILYQSGLLVYSFEPGQPIRDKISLPHAAIVTTPGRKDIHIDSNTTTFHIKCLTSHDFQQWMLAFRKFLPTGQETRRSMALSLKQATRQSNIGLNRSAFVAEEIGTTISTLDDAFTSLKEDLSLPKLSLLKGEKEKKDSMFGRFKKPHSNDSLGNMDPKSLMQLQASIDVLKSQHAKLLQALHEVNVGESSHTLHNPLPLTREEDEPIYSRSLVHDEAPFSPVFGQRHSRRSSMATTISDVTHEWFDAWDGEEPGVQEFVLDPDPSQDDRDVSHIVPSDFRDTASDNDSGTDTDADETRSISLNAPPDSYAAPLPPRRTRLPAPIAGDEGSLFAILKKNVGKDLSTITFPVTFNEPLTMLQRCAEELEYHGLLDKAADSKDPVERMAYIAAFAISGYAHTRYRSSRKGFNPMLGETFQDERMKFIAEKTNHNPVELAYHAEAKEWELTATSAGRTKFWGKSLEIIPLGASHVRIGDLSYKWKKPSSFMRNIMVGTKYLEHCGNMTIECSPSGLTCVCEFKQGTYWGTGANVVSGTIYSPSGEVLSRLEGKWDEQISQALDFDQFKVLWRATPPPKTSDVYYGFTSFGLTLNEMWNSMETKLPPTDSRLRPDVRALEEGRVDEAEYEKARVEELQRERRRQGRDIQPRWFNKVDDDWEYLGGYWEQRSWPDSESLW